MFFLCENLYLYNMKYVSSKTIKTVIFWCMEQTFFFLMEFDHIKLNYNTMKMCETNFINFDHVDCKVIVFEVRRLFLPSPIRLNDFDFS